MLLRILFTLILILVFNVFGMIFLSNYTEAHKIKDFERKIQSKILPEYCAYMQTGPRAGSPNGDRYKKLLGKSWNATHHYCWGLDKLNLAFQNFDNEHVYIHYLGSTVEEFNYVLDRSDFSFILKPEIFTRKGIVLYLLGRDGEAINVLSYVIQKYPHYEHSYIALSEYYSKNGIKDQAKKVLEIGLKNSPNSSLIKQALTKFRTE